MTPAEAIAAVAERAKCRLHVPDYADVLAEEVRRLRDRADQIDAEIDDALISATENAAESHEEEIHSYGAGYDGGRRDGLREALRIMRDAP